eukprot:1160507-Pelagomonas_calceolata.AAC.3
MVVQTPNSPGSAALQALQSSGCARCTHRHQRASRGKKARAAELAEAQQQGGRLHEHPRPSEYSGHTGIRGQAKARRQGQQHWLTRSSRGGESWIPLHRDKQLITGTSRTSDASVVDMRVTEAGWVSMRKE